MSNTSSSGGYLTATSTAPAEDDALVDIFTALVEGVTALPGAMIRPRWQAKPPKRPDPSVDWCAVGIYDDDADAQPVVEHNPSGAAGVGTSTLNRQEDITVAVTFYGPNARGFAKMLRDGLYIPQNWENINNSFISFVSTGKIVAAPEQINAQWYKRYDLTLFFRRTISREYSIQNIETAGITEHIENLVSNITVSK